MIGIMIMMVIAVVANCSNDGHGDDNGGTHGEVVLINL